MEMDGWTVDGCVSTDLVSLSGSSDQPLAIHVWPVLISGAAFSHLHIRLHIHPSTKTHQVLQFCASLHVPVVDRRVDDSRVEPDLRVKAVCPKSYLHPTLSNHCQTGTQLPPLDCTFNQSVRSRPLPSHFVNIPPVLLRAPPTSPHFNPQLPSQALVLPPAPCPQKICCGCRLNPSRVKSKVEPDAASLTIGDQEKCSHSAGGKKDRSS